MKILRCYRWIASLLLVTLALAACDGGTSTPIPSPTPPEGSQCGDGVCDGPEDAQNCPQDCQASQVNPPGSPCGDGICDAPEDDQNCPQDCQEQQTTTPAGEACQNPNPQRAVISEELLDWQNGLEDGGFEQGSAEVVLADFPQGLLERGTAERSQQAARSGSWGYAITTGADEGLTFSLKFYMEKGEETRFSFWAKSADGSVSLKPTVEGMDFSASSAPTQLYLSESAYSIRTEWTQVVFETNFDHAYAYALFSLPIPSNTTLYLDDITIEFPIWKMATYSDANHSVGGIPVPKDPAAPVHINFPIHIEDPSLIQNNETYFQQKTAVFYELARTFHEHGGYLTIQPEEDWVMACNKFAPGLLQEWAQDFNVAYSTHTHGPQCRDNQGRLRSSSDCNANKDTAGWDHSISDDEYPFVVEYVDNLHNLISQAAGIPVTDHNGNWEFEQAGRFSEIPMYTWSGYKKRATQQTYDVLINNPWRPTETNADEDIEVFLTHDPNTRIIYIPGWGQALTRHPERALERIRPILSQFIYYADPERVNTFYVVLHVDHFYSRTGDPNYILYDPATGETTYSDEFKGHIAYWEDVLTQLIDPLVQQGYLQWTSLPEIGELYEEWEAGCEAN
jgi:hypothetical protein